VKPETWLETLNCAVEGVLEAVRTQRHMRWHSLAALGVLVLAPRLGVTPGEFALLCLAAGLVLVAELVNTAFESLVDLVCPRYDPLARSAKDVAAGAVLVASFGAAAVGWVVLGPRLSRFGAALPTGPAGPMATAAILLTVIVTVVLLKALLGRGAPLHGGFPSGHAAVSFAVATLLALHTRDWLVAALAGLLALMVSHSRLLLRIHSRGEVLAGGALGAGLALALHYLVLPGGMP